MKEVAVGILFRNGRVLACQRNRNAKYPLKWEFPGGKIEPNETREQAIVRELYEELTIRAIVDAEFLTKEWTYSDSGSYRVTYFLIKSFAGEPVNKVFEQIQWVLPKTLSTMDILEGNREAVDLLVNPPETIHAAPARKRNPQET